MEPQMYYVKGLPVKRRKKHVVKKVIRVLFLAVLGVFLITACVLYQKVGSTIINYYNEAVSVVEESTRDDFENNQTSYVYASDGTEIAKLKKDKDVEYVQYSELPEDVLDAVVSIEDKRFWSHSGVDWLSTLKACYLLVANHGEITRGGSSITQQLARNVFLSFEKSYERKIREIFLALELEKKYSKEQILEFYVNNINYSNGYYGIGSAARNYFGKKVTELSDEEIAFLCAIPNNPTYYNPIKNFEHTVLRRNLILEEMYKQEYLSSEKYLKAVNSATNLIEEKQKFFNYESSYAIDCAVRILMEKSGFVPRYSFSSMSDYTEYEGLYSTAYSDATIALYTGGYKIYTSIDTKVQAELQMSIDQNLANFAQVTEEGIYLYQAASTVIDNETGLVIAIVGGRSQDTKGVRTLNRAFQSYRQPGSTIKPVIVYAPALEKDYTPDTKVQDLPIADGPKNSENQYLGTVTLRTAVEKSKNVVAWKIFDELGAENCLAYAQQMQFKKIVPDDYYNPAALGGLTYGTTTVEMASAYATLAFDGVYRDATCVDKLVNKDGVNIYDGQRSTRVYTQNVARDMTDILEGVVQNGTASGLTLDNRMPLACKTGTTNNQTVGWFCGYSPYYTVAVYVGADTNIPMSNLWGSTYPRAIWRQIEASLCKGKEVVAFKKSEKGQQITGSLQPETKAKQEKEPQILVDPAPESTQQPVTPAKPEPKTQPQSQEPVQEQAGSKNTEETVDKESVLENLDIIE